MIRDTNLAQAVSYRDELVRHRLLIPTAARGVYGFGHDFDRVLQGFDAFVTRVGQDDGAEVIRFPTLLPRGDLESSGYLKSFPHLWEQGVLKIVSDEFHDLLTIQLILGWHTAFPSPCVFIGNQE